MFLQRSFTKVPINMWCVMFTIGMLTSIITTFTALSIGSSFLLLVSLIGLGIATISPAFE